MKTTIGQTDVNEIALIEFRGPLKNLQQQVVQRWGKAVQETNSQHNHCMCPQLSAQKVPQVFMSQTPDAESLHPP